MARKPRPSADQNVRAEGQTRANPTELLTFPDVLARVPTGMPADYDNLLSAAVRDEAIVLQLQVPGEAEPGDTVQVLIDGIAVGEEVLVDAYFSEPEGVPLPLSSESRQDERTYSLNYHLILRSGNGDKLPGPGQQFVTDYTPPSIGLPGFAPEVVDDAVTLERLTTDADGNIYLPAIMAPYHGQAVGDLLTGYIDGVAATEPHEVLDGEVDTAIELRFPLAALELADDGRRAFTIDCDDRAGNRDVSDPVTLMVRLHALIPNPLPARVPSATDGLVNHDDADRPGGVQVDIPANSLVLPGDTVVVTWADYTSEPYPIVAGSENSDPLLSLFVPYADVYRAWFATSADSDTRVPANVSYVIHRGDLVAGTPDAATVVEVNLYVPGGIDPDPDNPGHGALQPPTVYSAGGSENFIPIAEQQQDGVVVVAWTPAIPGRQVFILDDILTIHFGSTTLSPSHVIDAADVAAAAPLNIVLPKEAIATESTGLVDVSYTIERPLTGGGTNTAVSPLQVVTVEDQADLPGGGELAEGRFPELNVYLTLGPAEIKRGTDFVGDYVDRRAGDRIRFEFEFVAGNAHRDDEVPIAERFHSGELVLAADGDPVTYLIPESFLNYRDMPPEQMHIHATYHVSRGASSEVHSPSVMVYLDCRGAAPALDIDTTPVQIIGTDAFVREAFNGEPPYTYTSSMPGIVVVPDETAPTIKGVTDGRAEITATDIAGSFKSYPVTVVGNTPFSIDRSDVEIIGTGAFSRNAKGGVPPYEYSSSAPDVVAVPQRYEGRVKGVSDGEAIITANDSAKRTGDYRVVVTGNTPFDIEGTLLEIIGTETRTRDAEGGKKPYTYVSYNPKVVRVPDESKGDIQGVADGDTFITASDANGTSKSYPVTVWGNIPFDIEDARVEISGTNTKTRDAKGGKKPYTYVSRDPNVVRVPDEHKGVIQGLADGDTFVTASDSNGGSKSYPVTVWGNTPFDIDDTRVDISGTNTKTRNAKGGRKPYTYVSNKPNVVRVPDPHKGDIQGVADGDTFITASDSNGGFGTYPVTVTGNTPALSIGQTTMLLNGAIYRGPGVVPNPPAEAFDTRLATGGRPPYQYRAEKPEYVDVDSSSGRVTSLRTGSTRVIAKDSAGNEVSYPVSVSNVQLVFGTGVHGTYTQCRQAAEAQGGHLPSLAEWNALRSCYNGAPGLSATLGWASDSAGIGKRWAIVPDTGATQALVDIGIGGGAAADGWGLKPV